MESVVLQPFHEIHARLVANAPRDFTRFLYDRIDWRARLIALVGPRGVGKTTLLLQHVARTLPEVERGLYLSADHVRVQALGLYEIGATFFRRGGEVLLVDEVHRYPGWTTEIKSLYDAFPAGRVVLSGSSAVELLRGGADLSRRLVAYRLPGMSFREFLNLELGLDLPAVDLATLLGDHVARARTILARLGGTVLGRFDAYLDHGVYPFYREGVELFPIRLANVIEKVVSDDIPSVMGVRPGTIPHLRKLLHLVASSEPFVPNIERLASALGVSRPSVYQYLEHLHRAGLLALLPPQGRGLKAARKPAKVCLDNANLFPALIGHAESRERVGTLREAFFAHQAGSLGALAAGARADFVLPGGQVVEVGGASKGLRQLSGEPAGWLALDDIEVGEGRRVPLWLFGFLY
jgi:predicted AAA+ superfamily ATPase